MKNKKLKYFNVVDYVVLSAIILYIFQFMAGVHNIDLGYNMRWINSEYDLHLVETQYKDITELEPESLYNIGIKQILSSTMSIIILFFFWIFYIIGRFYRLQGL